MAISNKSLDDWLEAYARGDYVPEGVRKKLANSKYIPHGKWLEAYFRRGAFVDSPVEYIYKRLSELEERIEALEKEKASDSAARLPVARPRRA